MLKKVTALLLALALIFCLCACGDTNTKTSDEKFTLIVGFDSSFPPYGYVGDNGDFEGFDLAMAAEVCRRLDWDLELKAINWEGKDAELETGTINCIWNGFTKNDREALYSWTVPYVDNTQVFVVKEDSGISSLSDLAGKAVMTQAASSALSALESEDCADLKASFSDLLEVADYESGFMELSSGAVDALAMDVGVANYQIAQHGGGFVILSEALALEQYAVGFKLGNDELMYTVQGVLTEMAQDGTMLEIAQDYVDKGLILESLCLVNAFAD